MNAATRRCWYYCWSGVCPGLSSHALLVEVEGGALAVAGRVLVVQCNAASLLKILGGCSCWGWWGRGQNRDGTPTGGTGLEVRADCQGQGRKRICTKDVCTWLWKAGFCCSVTRIEVDWRSREAGRLDVAAFLA